MYEHWRGRRGERETETETDRERHTERERERGRERERERERWGERERENNQLRRYFTSEHSDSKIFFRFASKVKFDTTACTL